MEVGSTLGEHPQMSFPQATEKFDERTTWPSLDRNSSYLIQLPLEIMQQLAAYVWSAEVRGEAKANLRSRLVCKTIKEQISTYYSFGRIFFHDIAFTFTDASVARMVNSPA